MKDCYDTKRVKDAKLIKRLTDAILENGKDRNGDTVKLDDKRYFVNLETNFYMEYSLKEGA